MKRTLTILAMIAAFAIMSSGCSQQDSNPLGPGEITAISFPSGPDHADPPQATTPTDLSGAVNGDDVELAWKHNSMAQSFYKIYRSRDGGAFQLVRTVFTCSYQDAVGGFHWNELTYKVTSVNYAGAESDYSNAVTVSYGAEDLPDIADVDFDESN